MTRPPVVVSLTVAGFSGSEDETCQIDRDEWDAWTVEQRGEYLQEMADEFAANHVSWGWHIADPADRADTED